MNPGRAADHGADLRLARIFFVRCLPTGFWVPYLGYLVLTLWVWEQGSGLESEQADWLQRAQLRQASWVLLACLGAPILILRSANMARYWRTQDADWFGPLPVSRWRWVRGCILGMFGAALLLTSITAILTESAVQGDAPSGRFERTLSNPGFSLLEGDAPRQWIQSDLLLEQTPKNAQLIFRPSISSGAGPSVEVGFQVLHGQESIEQGKATKALIFGPARVRVNLPDDAAGPARLSMWREPEGAPALLPRNHVDLILPLSSEHWISAELGLRALLFLVAWSVLAAGLGAWMRPNLAAGLCLASIGLSWWGGQELHMLPGAAGAIAWSHVGQGWAPGALATQTWFGAAVMLALGLLLLRAGIQRGRSI